MQSCSAFICHHCLCYCQDWTLLSLPESGSKIYRRRILPMSRNCLACLPACLPADRTIAGSKVWFQRAVQLGLFCLAGRLVSVVRFWLRSWFQPVSLKGWSFLAVLQVLPMGWSCLAERPVWSKGWFFPAERPVYLTRVCLWVVPMVWFRQDWSLDVSFPAELPVLFCPDR